MGLCWLHRWVVLMSLIFAVLLLLFVLDDTVYTAGNPLWSKNKSQQTDKYE